MKRQEELEDIFKGIDENEKKLIKPMLEEIVFLESQLKNLKSLPFIRIHPTDTSKQVQTVAAKQYKELSQSYDNKIRILCSLLHKVDNSAENELLKKLAEFEA